MTDEQKSSWDSVVQKILTGGCLARAEAGRLVETPLEELLFGADRIRRRFHNESIRLCAILNVKASKCSEDCIYCAQSIRYKTQAPVYELMNSQSVAEAARQAAAGGAQEFGLVAAWKKPARRDMDELCRNLEAVAQAGVEAHGSFGLLDDETARRIAAAGCREYNHNLETGRAFFSRICSTHSYEDRLASIRCARAAGMRICSGGIFGLGESWEDRLDLAFALRDIEPDTVPINFLHPIPGTPVGDRPKLAAREALRIIAVFRFILPKAQIKVCGGRELILGDLQSWMFRAGASSLMVGNYLTTRGRRIEDDLKLLDDLGLSVHGQPKVGVSV